MIELIIAFIAFIMGFIVCIIFSDDSDYSNLTLMLNRAGFKRNDSAEPGTYCIINNEIWIYLEKAMSLRIMLNEFGNMVDMHAWFKWYYR